MSINSAVEKSIRDAIDRGEFDNLAGKGKPLDLTSYFDTPEELRMAYSILNSGQSVPEEVELLNEIAEVKRRIGAETDEEKKAALLRKLNDRSLRLSLILERYRRK